MSGSLASTLRAGYSEVAGALLDNELEILARVRDSGRTSPVERNRLLARVVFAYQAGPRQLWAPVLLDLMAPSLIARMQRFCTPPSLIDEEEIRQQLVLEVLRAAARMPIHGEGRQMRVRLVTRANKAVVRWLRREEARQWHQTPIEVADEKVGRYG
jgi:hypothetical protein